VTATLLVLTPSHALQGGVERVIDDLAAGLPSHAFRVVVGLARGARFHDPDAYRRAHPRLDSLEFDDGTGTRLGRVRSLRRVIERVRPGLVLNARLFDAYEAAATLKLAGRPLRFAVTIQASEAEYVADLARYADFVDLCVTSGRRVASDVARFTTLPAERVVSIAGGVRPAVRLVEHDDARPLRLGYVGRLDQPQKRVLDLPRTLARLDARGVPWTCRIAGAGPAESELRAALAAQGFGARVTLDGWTAIETLYAGVYPEIDVLLHFAAFEGVTIAPREAMAHGGVPVVSRFEGLDEEGHFVDGETALTFEVGDVEAAAAAVERLHRDRTLLRRLSRAARASQDGPRSLDGSIAEWAAALRATLARPPRVGAAPPRLPPPPGRLARGHIPPRLAEAVRRLLRRRVRHADPGSEWPHRSDA
jgi:glycosyltransferase involved in cell wall biosynthesis